MSVFSFNSMKVRLKHCRVHAADTLSNLFQFHEGPIKTGCLHPIQVTCAEFQFHEGPIKTLKVPFSPAVETCFNSMKVRLKLPVTKLFGSDTTFQFHEGPIKTWSEKMANQQNQVSIP